MFRIIFTRLVLFALPFLCYAVWLWVQKKQLTSENWRRGPILWLSVIGAVLVIGSFVMLTFYGSMPAGKEFVPARFEHGQLIPGHYE